VLIDAPTAAGALSTAKRSPNPLLALPLASEASGAGSAGGGSIGWLGGGVLLVLLAGGVVVELGLPRRRRNGTGIA
jgi:hypothetical protein